MGTDETKGQGPPRLGDDALCTVSDVATALGVSLQDVGQLVLAGALPSVVIPGMGRRLRVGDLRRYILSLPVEEDTP